MPSEPTSFIYVTAPSRSEALELGRALTRERLAACANVLPGITSVFEWQGVVTEAEEAVLILKTRSSLVESLIARAKELHSYECPCIVALPITAGYEPFLHWVAEQTRSL